MHLLSSLSAYTLILCFEVPRSLRRQQQSKDKGDEDERKEG